MPSLCPSGQSEVNKNDFVKSEYEDSIANSLSEKQISTTERASIPEQVHHAFERFSIEENSPMSVPPENRTLYLNCTNPAVECTRISCKLGTFANSLTVAKLTITVDIQLRNFRDKSMETRDIIFFVSNGSMTIVQSRGIVQRAENKPDSTLVGTTFVGSPVASRIAGWIIVLSILLGILLLVLLTLGLVKLGFFHRKNREELEVFKAKSDAKHGLVLYTNFVDGGFGSGLKDHGKPGLCVEASRAIGSSYLSFISSFLL